MIPSIDLAKQYDPIREEVEKAILACAQKNHYCLGPEVEDFERAFATFCGATHAIGVNSGTSALHLCLEAAGIGPGDEVITAPYTFVASVAAIEYTGAKPVFADIDPITYTIDPKKVENAITSRTKAILPVHLYGLPADMDPLLDIAQRNDLFVIEDAAQAHGAVYNDKKAGTLGHLAAFSFYPTKNLGAFGDAGAVVTNDDALAEKVRLMRVWGSRKKYFHELKGFNYRMDGIQGAVLNVKLRYLAEWNERRMKHAAFYHEGLRDLGLQLPATPKGRQHVYHIYMIPVEKRDRIQKLMLDEGVEATVFYPLPVHLQNAYQNLGYQEGDFPISEDIAKKALCLPMYPELDESQTRAVVHALRQALS